MRQQQLVTIIALALSTAATAQDSTTLETVYVDSVYAVPTEIDNTGSSVTVLTQQDFQDRNATYVTDILKTVPGVSISSNGGHGTTSGIFMRGASSKQTLVIIDGVRMNSVGGSGFNFGTLPLDNIDSIEILRGEQSALWGSDAMGGVIKITTKNGKNADKPLTASFNLGGGSNTTLDFDGSLSGRQGGLYYALNVSRNTTHSISARSENTFTYQAQDGSTIQTGGAVEDDHFQRKSISATLGYDFDNAGVEVFAKHNSYTIHYDPSSLALESTTDPFTQRRENIVKLSGHLGSLDSLIRQSAYVSNTTGNSKTTSQYPSENDDKRLTAGYQLDFNFDRDGATTQALTALLDYRKDRLKTSNYNNYKDIKQTGVALEYRLFNEADHALSVGVRHNSNSEFANDTTYRLSGGYRLSDNFRLHASLGTGVRNPSMYDYYGYYGNYTPNPDLKPEKSRGGEIGMLIESSDGRHSLDATYFDRHTDDLIDTNSSYTQSINLDGTSKARGLELSYRGELSDALSLYANYTYTKTEDSSGTPLRRRPKSQASAGVKYQFNDKLSADANVLYVGERLDNYYDSATYQSKPVDMPDYTVVNLGADYKVSKNLHAYLSIDNVFDKEYENIIGYGQPTRTFYIGIKGTW